MATIDVIVYGNGDLFREFFNAIVAAFGKGSGGGDFNTLFHIAILLAGFTVVYSFIVRRDLMEMVKWLGLFYVAVYMLFLPEATVAIQDRVNQKFYLVDHVPLGLAVMAGYTSTIGDALTRDIESQFTMPDYQPYHKTGMVFASRMVEAASQFEIIDSQFDQNMREFIHQCVFYDLLLNKYSITTLMTSSNVWSVVAGNASPARAFIYNEEVTICRDGARKLTDDWKKQIDYSAEQYGRRFYPSEVKDAAKTKLLKELPISYQYLTKLSDSATAIMQQNMMANAIQRGIVSMGSKLNAPAALESYAFARAQEQKRLTNKTLGDMAAHWLPLMKNAFEAIMYGSFIFIVLLSVFPFGWAIVKNYIFTLMWIQMWAPLYAIINLIVSYYAQAHTSAAVDGALSLQAMSGVMQINSDISGLAGYLTLSVPFLSAGLVKGMASTFTHISQYVGGVTQSAGGAASAEAVTGNISLGNTSVGNHNMFNTSANHLDTSGRVNTGMLTTTMAGGSQASVTADGSVMMDMRNSMSNLGASINWADTLRTSYSQQAERSTSAGVNSAISASHAVSSAIRNAHDMNSSLSTSSSSGEGWNTSMNAGFASAVSKVERMTQDFADRHHVSYNEAANVLASAYVSGQVTGGLNSRGSPVGKALSMLGVDASASVSGGGSRTAGHNSSTDRGALFSEAQSYVRDQHYSENVDMVERAASDQSYRTNNEKSNRLMDSMSASFDKARSYRDDMNSNFSEAESARTNASLAQDNAQSINANANQQFMDWMSNQPGTNGQGKMGLHQAETLMKDPNMQMYYAKQYMEQHRSELTSNWNHGMAHNKSQIESHSHANSRQISKSESVSSGYRASSKEIDTRAHHQGLSPENFVNTSARENATRQLDAASDKVRKEHNVISQKGSNQSSRVEVEKNTQRNGSLAKDFISNVDTKEHNKEQA